MCLCIYGCLCTYLMSCIVAAAVLELLLLLFLHCSAVLTSAANFQLKTC